MKTTLEIPDELYRQSKSTAALRGETLKEFVNTALKNHLHQVTQPTSKNSGWRRAFGAASADQTADVDRLVNEEFEKIDLDHWK